MDDRRAVTKNPDGPSFLVMQYEQVAIQVHCLQASFLVPIGHGVATLPMVVNCIDGDHFVAELSWQGWGVTELH